MARTEETKNTYKILVGELLGKPLFGRTRRWQHSIKIALR